MQKYKDQTTTAGGSAIRGAQVTVLDENGSLATLFEDRYGNVPASNPRITADDGTFQFYAANGRYTLECNVEGVQYVEDDVVLLADPEELGYDDLGLPEVTQNQAEDENDTNPYTWTPERVWQAAIKWWQGQTVDTQKIDGSGAAVGQVLAFDGTGWSPITVTGAGTVTTVDMSVPTGLRVSGGPITSGGTFAVTYDQGYAIPLATDTAKGVTAHSWGDHSQAGYAVLANITSDINDGLTAYSWGDHSQAGYNVQGEDPGATRTNSQNDARFAHLSGGDDADFVAMPKVGGDPLIKAKDAAKLSGGDDADFVAMPKVDGSPIVESGSSANGSWTKWADGTMICWGSVNISVTNPPEYETWSFPQLFSATPVLTTNMRTVAIGATALASSATGITTSSADIYMYRTNSTSTEVQCIAIGRWE